MNSKKIAGIVVAILVMTFAATAYAQTAVSIANTASQTVGDWRRENTRRQEVAAQTQIQLKQINVYKAQVEAQQAIATAQMNAQVEMARIEGETQACVAATQGGTQIAMQAPGAADVEVTNTNPGRDTRTDVYDANGKLVSSTVSHSNSSIQPPSCGNYKREVRISDSVQQAASKRVIVIGDPYSSAVH